MTDPSGNSMRAAQPATVIRRTLRNAVWIPIVIAMCLFALLTWEINSLLRHGRWVSHTEAVIGQIHYVQQLLVDQETGLRGYLLTGERPFLEPYDSSVKRLPTALADLDHLIADNGAQRIRAGRIRQGYETWRANASANMARVDGGSTLLVDPNDVRAIHLRKERMDSLRSTVSQMIAEEQRLLESRSGEVVRVTRLVTTASALAFLLLAIGLFVIMRGWISSIGQSYERLIAEKNEAEETERQARIAAEAIAADATAMSQELERRFREMNDALESANQELARVKG